MDYLAQTGYDPKYGARQLQRSIQELLITPLAKSLNLIDYDDQLVVEVEIKENALVINVDVDPMGLDLLLEALDKINYADHASRLRRLMARFQEGHFFNRLMSKLDILEREKSKANKRFWESGQKGAQYTQLLQSREKVELLIQEIGDLEESLSKACLSLKPYAPQHIDEIKDWEKRSFDYKLDLYTQHQPEEGTCHLAIYGTQLSLILDFYLKLFKLKDFDWSAQTLWFRESYYNEEISLPPADLSEDQNSTTKRRESYIEKDYFSNRTDNFKAIQKGDVLYGIAFKLSGKACHLYLKEEEGLQRWRLSEKEDYLYQVSVSGQAPEWPVNIHRREFYKGNPRRIIEPPQFKDTRLKIKRELDLKSVLPLIQDLLDKAFVQKLNTELI